MALLNSKYNGNGGLWKLYNHPKIAGQGSIQIGGRKIALTLWYGNRGTGSAPDFNITVNEQKTAHDDVVWFRGLQQPTIVGHKADIVIVDDLKPSVDDDIPF